MKHHLWRRLSAPFLAAVLALSTIGTVAAYELAPSARFASSAISDGVLTVCYGVNTSEGIYVNRSLIAEYLKGTWGVDGYGSLRFVSNGLCDNDGSNIRIVWDRSMSCASDSPTGGYVNDGPFEWTSMTVYLNADCNIRGLWDWTCHHPTLPDSDSTNNGQWCIHVTIAHEVGHTLGIRHSNDVRALMAQGNTCNGMGVSRGVSKDDMRALVDEYDEKINVDTTSHIWVAWVDTGNAPLNPPCWG